MNFANTRPHPVSKVFTTCVGAVALLLGAEAWAAHAAEPEATPTPAQLDFYEKKVRPLLANSCYSCHAADTKPSGGLRVDDINGLLTGGNGGPALVRGAPEKSLLLARIRHSDSKKKMPKEGDELTDAQIADLEAWIKDGAAWPPTVFSASLTKAPARYEELKTNHWAWQPLSVPAVPKTKDKSWAKSDVDRFVLARLEKEKLRPVGDADRSTLIRRITFDLTGLPPTPEEIETFVGDKAPNAYEKVVDRLLASRHFAEHWGRHWLDVARYAESTGPSRNIPYPHAWKYRDYVINAVDADIPFDRFVQEQIAGDLLPAENPKEKDRLLTATGFLALGVKDVNQRFKERFIMDNIDEKIDTVSRSVIGLTVSCARCHDHKFDPIPTADYYSLAGIFASSDDRIGLRNQMGGAGLAYYVPKMLVKLASANDMPAAPKEKVEKLEADVAEAKKAWDEIRGTKEGLSLDAQGKRKQLPFRLKYEKLQAELNGLTDPAECGFAVHGASDSTNILDTAIRIRGEAERLGPVVHRGFLTAFAVPDAPEINPQQSGRKELALWLTSPKNPLTPRVAVNRVWNSLYGQGLVASVDNFGINGEKPTHPELLDYLANQFVQEGWSLKKLVRTLVLTRSYQLSSESTEKHVAKDPANHLIWRYSPRRLTAEEVRDAILDSAGTLKQTPPTGSVTAKLKMIEIRDNGPEAKSIQEESDRSLYRSIYLPLLRGLTPKSLAAFDPVEQNLVTGHRETTTVPTQALYLLNSSFVRNQSLALAVRLLHEEGKTDDGRIEKAFLLTLGRKPTQPEVKSTKAFLEDYKQTLGKSATGDQLASVKAKATKAGTIVEAPVPEDADNIDRTTLLPVEEEILPETAEAASWLSFAQALYASAEFRYVR